MSKITKVVARQVYDSRGNPTIEAEVFANNMKARAICPSGASTGSHEAYEKRDISNKKYLGKSVLKPVQLINKIISKKLKNQNVHNQEKIDHILIKLDGTKQKTKYGANSLLAVSMATKKLSARINRIPLFKTFLIKNNYKLPLPLMNVINGGAHANNGLRIQEFMIRPDRAKSITEAIRMCFLVINNLKNILKARGESTSVGDEGGFAPMINDNEDALKLIIKAIKKAEGGILFIDEAYSLGNPEGKDSYAKECIDTLTAYLSECPETIVFVIGYKDALDKCFFSFNKGLERRFTYRFSIEKYDPEELKQIIIKIIRKEEWDVENEEEIEASFFKDNRAYFKYNGGDMLNLFTKCKFTHSIRFYNKNRKSTAENNFEDIKKKINYEDIQNAFKLLKKDEKFKNRKNNNSIDKSNLYMYS